MKLTIGSTVASLLLFCDLARGQSLLQTRFNIAGPQFEYDQNKFTMTFEVSNFVQDNMVAYTLYDGLNCRDGGDNDITENSGYLLSRIRTDLRPLGDGSGLRTIKVQSEVVPADITSSPIYKEDVDGNVVIEYCVRFGVYNTDKDGEFAMEANYIESPIKLVINMNAGFQVDAALSNSDIVLNEVSQNVAVEAYICDNDENIVPLVGKEQGQTVRVCVSPTPNNLAAGALMRQLESFKFRRLSPVLVQQAAIEPKTGGVSANQFTIVSCQPGSTVCAFETLLGADFFMGPGEVVGQGTAFLQLGVGSSAAARKLQGTPNQILADKPTGYSVTLNLITVDSSYQLATTSGAALTTFTTTFLGFAFLTTVLTLF
uniref:Dolichyl-diphosphooligosaccharide--protein glycosyltransferase subunit 1 n=1 Tax=Pseudo-nitzschia australis TaxID=44445 RepID=A0A7S4ABL4_9STRA|mmetsp:Transcript_2468/g.5388  ORF Transcript_2468/g.5388 Transcript_2468/m.5388 type:complete len:372 (+) Transcript_2468:124-1239(+)